MVSRKLQKRRSNQFKLIMNKSRNISFEKTAPSSDICPTVVAGDVMLSSQAKYTIPKACKIIGIGETKMRELIQQGLMPVIKIGDKILLLASDLEAFLRGHYGVVQVAETVSTRMPALPDSIAKSKHLR